MAQAWALNSIQRMQALAEENKKAAADAQKRVQGLAEGGNRAATERLKAELSGAIADLRDERRRHNATQRQLSDWEERSERAKRALSPSTPNRAPNGEDNSRSGGRGIKRQARGW